MSEQYGLDPKQLVQHVIAPVLAHLGLYSLTAVRLCLGTAMHESRLRYVKQLGKGPALGIYQCEPATHRDLYDNFLKHQPVLRQKVIALASLFEQTDPPDLELIGNLNYATAICRVDYYREKAALPPANNAEALAAYWKSTYNSKIGRGTIEQALPHFMHAVEIT